MQTLNGFLPNINSPEIKQYFIDYASQGGADFGSLRALSATQKQELGIIISHADQKLATESIKELLYGTGNPDFSSFVQYIVNRQRALAATTHEEAGISPLQDVSSTEHLGQLRAVPEAKGHLSSRFLSQSTGSPKPTRTR